MTIRAGWITPMLLSSDVERSLGWWARLGFETVDVDRGEDGAIFWARMHCQGGAVMFLRAEDEIPGTPGQRPPFYMYSPDMPALREQLLAEGVATGPISYPPYMRSGEICLTDPDGYTVFVGHWGDAEHEKWERERVTRI